MDTMFRDTQSSSSAFFLQKAAGFAAATAVRGEKEKMKTINQDWKEWEENPGEIMGESKVPPLSGGEHPPPPPFFLHTPTLRGQRKRARELWASCRPRILLLTTLRFVLLIFNGLMQPQLNNEGASGTPTAEILLEIHSLPVSIPRFLSYFRFGREALSRS